MRLQQIVQPASLGAFFKCDLQTATQPVDKLQHGARFGLDDAFHHYLAAKFRTAIEMLSLCTSMPIFLVLVIEGVPCRRDEPSTQTLLQKGRPFIMCGVLDSRLPFLLIFYRVPIAAPIEAL
jgi:hypothetical protein